MFITNLFLLARYQFYSLYTYLFMNFINFIVSVFKYSNMLNLYLCNKFLKVLDENVIG